jgi:hypothetical protein
MFRVGAVSPDGLPSIYRLFKAQLGSIWGNSKMFKFSALRQRARRPLQCIAWYDLVVRGRVRITSIQHISGLAKMVWQQVIIKGFDLTLEHNTYPQPGLNLSVNSFA